MKVIIKGRQHLKMSLLAVCGQLIALSNQIAGFLEQQYLWKDSIYTLDFLHGDLHREIVSSKVQKFIFIAFNPLVPGGNKKVTHT